MVCGDVLGGVRVVVAARLGQPLIELVVRHMRGAFEHQVLEQVRATELSGELISGPDVEGLMERDHVGAVVLDDDHRETVCERLDGGFDVERVRISGICELHAAE